jgi:hypothetical protein
VAAFVTHVFAFMAHVLSFVARVGSGGLRVWCPGKSNQCDYCRNNGKTSKFQLHIFLLDIGHVYAPLLLRTFSK